jgi:predicted DNA binding protein
MTTGDTRQPGDGGTHLELDVWHPDCWTLEVTRETGAGLIARGLYTVDGVVQARFTGYGETEAAVDALVGTARDSGLTDAVRELEVHLGDRFVPVPGRATRELLVEYPSERSIYEPLVSREFVPGATVDIRDGREYWTVVIDEDRTEIQRRLDDVRAEMDAEVEVRRIISSDGVGSPDERTEALSHQQSTVIRHAFRAGYYEWPRQVTAADLAADLDISKSTVLEHLRKAESKVLRAYGLTPDPDPS